MPSSIPTKTVPNSRFVGRSIELASLLAVVKNVERGKGAAVLVSGEPGIGKTRLIAEVCRLSEGTATWATSRCSQANLAPFAPLLALFEALSIPTESLQDVVDLSPADSYGKVRLWRAIVAALEHRARAGGLVLFLDDVQWADPETLDFLGVAFERLAHHPISLLMTCRALDLTETPLLEPLIEGILQHRITKVTLPRLSTQEIHEVVYGALQDAPTIISEDQRIEIIRLADGNPLYAKELLQEAIYHRSVSVPDVIRLIAESRLRSLTPETRQVVLSSSAFGGEFSSSVLSVILDRPLTNVIERLQDACISQLIVEERAGWYRFSHELLREAIYGLLTLDFARETHRLIALEMERSGERDAKTIGSLARHYGAAGNTEEALRCNVVAGEAAMKNLGYGAASEYFKRALDLAQTDPKAETAALIARLADALRLNGRSATAVSYYSRALEKTAPSDIRTRELLVRGLARSYLDGGNTRLAIAAIADLSELVGSKSSVSTDLVFLAALSEFNLKPRVAGPWFEYAMTITAQFGESSRCYLQALDASRECASGNIEAAQESYHQILNVARDLSDPQLVIRILIRQANELSNLGRVSDALDASGEAFNLARDLIPLGQPDHITRVFSCCTYASELARAGRFVEARRSLKYVGDLSFDSTIARIVAESIQVRIDAICGEQTSIVISNVETPLLDLALATRHDGTIASAAEGLAMYHYVSGNLNLARSTLHVALGALQDGIEAHEMLLLVAELGAPKDVELAQKLLNESILRCFAPKQVAYTSLFEAFTCRRQGNRSTMQRRARRAAVAFEQMGERYRYARAVELSGGTTDAIALFEGMGAVFDVSRVKGSRKVAPRGTLTERQEELRHLVSLGLSNAQIAAELGISVGTVRIHLMRMFKRLGIHSRGQLMPK